MKFRLLLAVILQLSIVQSAYASAPGVPDETGLLDLAARYYPAIVRDGRSASELVLGFLLDSDGGVVRNTAGFAPQAGQRIDVTLEAMFPGYSVARMNRGALCVPNETRRAAKFCVYWLQLHTGQSG